VAEEHAAGTGFDLEVAAKSEACQAARAGYARRIFRKRELIGAHLQVQPPSLAKHANVRLRRADQGNAVHQCGRHIERGPSAAEAVPLQHHAVAAKVENGGGGGNSGVHASQHAPSKTYFKS
jgi:hypothetical protein